MAQKSWFFNSAPGDPRVYQASDFAQYFGKVLSTGLLHVNEVPGLNVKAGGTDLRTYVEPGSAIMEGYAYENTANEYLSHSLPEVSLDRIDRVVLRLDKKNANRYIKLFVREGEPASSPVPPTLQRDSLVWELSLAQVRIRANTSTISTSDVFDERLDRTVAGLTFSLISKPSMADIQRGEYAVVATTEGQTDFEIPLSSFDKVGDGLTVYVGGKKAEYSSYQVIYPRTVRFNVGLPIGTKVEFGIIRGVLKLADDYVVTAGEVGMVDAGGYYESENVEGALQKIGTALFSPRPLIYGVEIDENNINPNTSVTYIEDALKLNIRTPEDWLRYWPFSEIKPCKVRPLSNEFLYYLNPNNFNQKEDGTPSDITSLTDGDVFTEIPKIWWNIKYVNSKVQIRISPQKVDDDWVCLAHTIGNVEVPFIYMGIYHAYNDIDNKLRSLSNKAPINSTFNGSYLGNAANNNCEPAGYYQRLLLTYILSFIMTKSRDLHSFFGKGVKVYTSTGGLNTIGMYSPSVGSDTDSGKGSKFLGMEHITTYVASNLASSEKVWGLTVNEINGERIIKIFDGVNERTFNVPDLAYTGSTAMFVGKTTGNSEMGMFPLAGTTGSSSTQYCSRRVQAVSQTVGTDVYGPFSYVSGGTYHRIMYRPLINIKK